MRSWTLESEIVAMLRPQLFVTTLSSNTIPRKDAGLQDYEIDSNALSQNCNNYDLADKKRNVRFKKQNKNSEKKKK